MSSSYTLEQVQQALASISTEMGSEEMAAAVHAAITDKETKSDDVIHETIVSVVLGRLSGTDGTSGPRGTSDPKPCIYHLAGRCRFGSKCQYSHDAKGPTHAGFCQQHAVGACKHGARCIWPHVDYTLRPGLKLVNGKVIAPLKYGHGRGDPTAVRCDYAGFCPNSDCPNEHWCGRTNCHGPCAAIHTPSGKGVMTVRVRR